MKAPNKRLVNIVIQNNEVAKATPFEHELAYQQGNIMNNKFKQHIKNKKDEASRSIRS